MSALSSAIMSTKPLVLVVGATGRTGQQIVAGLVRSGAYRVAAAVRPASLAKPSVEKLRESGVEIRPADIQADGVAKLKDMLSGVDVLISAVSFDIIREQEDVLVAAKEAGVKRVIPCDFGTPGAKGVRDLHDEKLRIREFVRSLGVGYTFVDIGWWNQLTLPERVESKNPYKALFYEVFGAGDKKMLVSNVEHVGDYLARIIGDDRTLNKAVIVWEDEVSLLQAKEIGERVSGEGEALKALRVYVSAEEILKRAAAGKEENLRTHSFESHALWTHNQYQYSIHILGEDTLENAKALGYLDVKELYPDLAFPSLEDYAKDFYKGDTALLF
ncbi:hypothetical protein A0H81_07784 [Grifola frondosa]|uniref:NmrA-like domain-containing protein n=1 Tax=Grifola frondosa TaxID=5627 RepID=A0A1C7M6I4_GRIFR|nr:hypothetical protein A0H81_07784 [Grifola frondosa]